eukprot:scaffold1883_cov261-Pinguiococcus_pyrenoidosus.AAC.41
MVEEIFQGAQQRGSSPWIHQSCRHRRAPQGEVGRPELVSSCPVGLCARTDAVMDSRAHLEEGRDPGQGFRESTCRKGGVDDARYVQRRLLHERSVVLLRLGGLRGSATDSAQRAEEEEPQESCFDHKPARPLEQAFGAGVQLLRQDGCAQPFHRVTSEPMAVDTDDKVVEELLITGETHQLSFLVLEDAIPNLRVDFLHRCFPELHEHLEQESGKPPEARRLELGQQERSLPLQVREKASVHVRVQGVLRALKPP